MGWRSCLHRIEQQTGKSASADSRRRADTQLFWDRKENYPKLIVSSSLRLLSLAGWCELPKRRREAWRRGPVSTMIKTQ